MKKLSHILLLFFYLNLNSQDPIFTQFYNVPEYLNPSFMIEFLEVPNAKLFTTTHYP